VQTTTKELTQTYFMLVKTTNTWLQLPVKERFKFKENIITPILEKYSTVKMRFFDSEAFSGRVTDILMWETANIIDYQFLIDELRETPFWGTYFEVVEIIPAIEDGHLLSYPEEARR
jgi:dolichyl-phosphate-mannose--protein O-mannosyl transferase